MDEAVLERLRKLARDYETRAENAAQYDVMVAYDIAAEMVGEALADLLGNACVSCDGRGERAHETTPCRRCGGTGREREVA